MFHGKRIEKLEDKLDTLIKELQNEGALGLSGPWIYAYNPNRNASLGRDIRLLTKRIKSTNQAIEALMEYLDVEWVKEPEIRIKKKKKK